ncbi:MAG: hypothetical protein WBK91_04440 [Alphaproteobacteria bacterium]
MFGFARLTGHTAIVVMMGVLASGCALQETKPLDVRVTEFAPIRTIAIATIATRPSQSFPLFTGNRGELVRVLGKYEDELTNALLNQGFNVIPVGQSALIYNSGNLEYEISYLHNTPDYMARSRGEEELAGVARKLRADSNKMIGRRDDKRMFVDDHDKTDQITSPNTRIFPEIGLNYRMMLPRFTENGGALDNRFMSDASRMAIGEITRDMGADAYLLIDANLVLSARQEGYVLTGLTGGSRYPTLDGTAALVRNDGAILGVDWFRGQAVLPVGGVTQIPFSTERASGIHGFHQPMDQYTLLEGSYQAIRVGALDLADRYSKYRNEGRIALAKAEAERRAAAGEAEKAAKENREKVCESCKKTAK